MKVEKKRLYQARYCGQEEFSLAVCMKGSVYTIECPFNKNSYEDRKKIDNFTERGYNTKIVTSGLAKVAEILRLKSILNPVKVK